MQTSATPDPVRTSLYTDIIVAVHGIGAQQRNSTLRSVAVRLAEVAALQAPDRPYMPFPQPLGYFYGHGAHRYGHVPSHTNVKAAALVYPLDDTKSLSGKLQTTGFSEVFWADIPQDVVKEGRTLEETKAWARTVVARARTLHAEAVATTPEISRKKEPPPDFDLAAEVLDEIIETVRVLGNLTFLADKAGIFRLDLEKVLNEYLGDVQLVTEFEDIKLDIVSRFQQAMEDIHREHPQARIHIVAHSEGTVVSFLGLLYALSLCRVEAAEPEVSGLRRVKQLDSVPEWLAHVHGYLTIGSPIDKHLLLWRRLWTRFKPHLSNKALMPGQIRWRNYYDYGDPVGFKLDAARLWLEQKECTAFEFCGCKACSHDIGFARYFMPGMAHNEYWGDRAVFEHFVNSTVADGVEPARNPPPRDRRIVSIFSWTIPYLLSFAILLTGTFILYRCASNFAHSEDELLEKYVRYNVLGTERETGVRGWQLCLNALGLTCLFAGTTLLVQVRRLSREWTTCTMAGLLFLGSCLVFATIVSGPSRAEIGALFAYLTGNRDHDAATWIRDATIGTCLAALVVALMSMLANRKRLDSSRRRAARHAQSAPETAVAAAAVAKFRTTAQPPEDRRKRWFFKGMRPLMVFGIAVTAVMIVGQMWVQKKENLVPVELPPNVESMLNLMGTPLPDAAHEVDPTLTGDLLRRAVRSGRLDPAKLSAIITAFDESRPLTGTETAADLEARSRDLRDRKLSAFNALAKGVRVAKPEPPVWPVLLALGAFLYLWWLSALLFDLSFVWHRYIRNARTNRRLMDWSHYTPNPITKCTNVRLASASSPPEIRT